MGVRLVARDGKIVPPEIHTVAFGFCDGHVEAFCDGVMVTPSEALARLTEHIQRSTLLRLQQLDDEIARAISEPGAIL
jgi:prepilin-type processing-associated H-X9-DG protein